jgi:hypothetical protein
VVDVAAGRLVGDVVGRQPDVGVGAAVVLLDVGLEVVGVGDRSETWRQRGKGRDLHVVVVVADLSRVIIPRCGHDMRSRLVVRVRHRTLGVAVVCLVLGTPPVLDVVVFAVLAVHDPVDTAWRTVLAVVVEATSKLSLLVFTMALVDVAASVATMPVLVEFARRSTLGTTFARGWLTSSWIVGSLLCAGRLDRLRECRLVVDAADLDTTLFSSTKAVATRT